MGTVLLIIGLIILLNSWSSHVPNYVTYSYREVKANETLAYSVLTAPVGIGNITIGYNQEPGSSSPLPPGINETIVLPVHLLVQNPSNLTLVERDIITPYSYQINFNQRGEYTVYLTNKGTEASPIPAGLIFSDTNGNSNRETDKFVLSIILLIAGSVLVFTSLLVKRSTTIVKLFEKK